MIIPTQEINTKSSQHLLKCNKWAHQFITILLQVIGTQYQWLNYLLKTWIHHLISKEINYQNKVHSVLSIERNLFTQFLLLLTLHLFQMDNIHTLVFWKELQMVMLDFQPPKLQMLNYPKLPLESVLNFLEIMLDQLTWWLCIHWKDKPLSICSNMIWQTTSQCLMNQKLIL